MSSSSSFRCYSFLNGKDCKYRSRCYRSHAYPSHVDRATQCQPLVCTAPDSNHYVDFFCLGCDALIASGPQIHHIHKNRVWVYTPSIEPQALRSLTCSDERQNYALENKDKGRQCEFVYANCARCKLGLGKYFVKMRNDSIPDSPFTYAFRLNYIHGKQGQNLMYVKVHELDRKKFNHSLSAALANHEDREETSEDKQVLDQVRNHRTDDTTVTRTPASTSRPGGGAGSVSASESPLRRPPWPRSDPSYRKRDLEAMIARQSQSSTSSSRVTDADLNSLQDQFHRLKPSQWSAVSTVAAAARNIEVEKKRLEEEKAKVAAAAAELKEKEQEGSDCKVCFLPMEKRMVLLPCGHTGICQECAERLINIKPTCPVCRGKVKEMHRVYE